MNSNMKAPWHLWLVGSIAVLWNAFGVMDYTMTQLQNRSWFSCMGFDEVTTDAMLEFLGNAPSWADASWACGVWGGLLGSFLLLARSKWSVTAFALSIVGVLGSMLYQAGVDYPAELTDMGNSPIMFVVLTIAVGLLIYARWLRKRGVTE